MTDAKPSMEDFMTDDDDRTVLRRGIAATVGSGLVAQNSRLFVPQAGIYNNLRVNLDGLIDREARNRAENQVTATDGERGRTRLFEEAGIPEAERQNLSIFTRTTRSGGVTSTEYIIATRDDIADRERAQFVHPRAIIADVRGPDANRNQISGTVVVTRSPEGSTEPTVVRATANLHNGVRTTGEWRINQNGTMHTLSANQTPNESGQYEGPGGHVIDYSREQLLEAGREAARRDAALPQTSPAVATASPAVSTEHFGAALEALTGASAAILAAARGALSGITLTDASQARTSVASLGSGPQTARGQANSPEGQSL